jgi:hypothetical protein
MTSFKIFPYGIRDGEKVPLVAWKTEASNDPEKIKQWQAFYGDQIKGYGLPTGHINGLWALDIDVKNDGNGYNTLNSWGVEQPQTAYQYTPSGGMHLFFKLQPDTYHPTTVNTETKLDTRGEGGFVWLYNPVFNLPLASTPSWVWNNVVAKQKKDKSQEVTGSPIQFDPTIAMNEFNQSINAILNAGQGERNHTLNTHAYVIGRLVANGALPYEYAYEQLKIAALKIGLTERESHATIMSGLSNGKVNPHTHPFGDRPPEPAITIIPPMPMDTPKPRWTPTKGTLQMLQDWTKLRKPQLFEDWATEDIHLTSAVGGVGKTTLKLDEAICLATGEPFLGFPCKQPGLTLFIVGEDSEQKLYAMVGKMCKQRGYMEPGNEHKLQAVMDNIVIKRADDICLAIVNPRTRMFTPNEEDLNKIYEAIDDLKPKNIVLDPIAMFWGDESGGNSMAMAVSKAVQKILSRSNACVDMISHIAKDSHSKKDVSQFSGRGGTALANHSRVVRTLLALNENEYREYTGEDIPEGHSAIYCYVSKFSDGSPLLNKPFIILRNGYMPFVRKDIKSSGFDSVAGDFGLSKQNVYQFIKNNSTENKPMTLELLQSHFYLSNPRLSNTEVKSIITVLKGEGLVTELEHDNVTIGSWFSAKT